MVITRVGPVSVAKVAAVLYAGIGLIVGALLSLVALAGSMALPTEEAGIWGTVFGAASIILLPLLYGAFGFVATLIGAALFNVAAGLTGGVEIETK